MKTFILITTAVAGLASPAWAQQSHTHHMEQVAAVHKHDMALDRQKERERAHARLEHIRKGREADRREAELRTGKIRKDQLADRRDAIERTHKIRQEKAADRRETIDSARAKDKAADRHAAAAPTKPATH